MRNIFLDRPETGMKSFKQQEIFQGRTFPRDFSEKELSSRFTLILSVLPQEELWLSLMAM